MVMISCILREHFKMTKEGMDLRVNIVTSSCDRARTSNFISHNTKTRLFASIPFNRIQRVIVIIGK